MGDQNESVMSVPFDQNVTVTSKIFWPKYDCDIVTDRQTDSWMDCHMIGIGSMVDVYALIWMGYTWVFQFSSYYWVIHLIVCSLGTTSKGKVTVRTYSEDSQRRDYNSTAGFFTTPFHPQASWLRCLPQMPLYGVKFIQAPAFQPTKWKITPYLLSLSPTYPPRPFLTFMIT